MPTTTKSQSSAGTTAALDFHNAPDWLERLANGLDGAPRMMAAAFHHQAGNGPTAPEGNSYIQISSEAVRDITGYLRQLAGAIRTQQPAQMQANKAAR